LNYLHLILIFRQTCLKNINAGAAFPLRRDDFATEEAWNYWRTLETTHLQQLVVAMVSFNPELAKSTPSDMLPNYYHGASGQARPGSLYERPSRNASISSRNSLFQNEDDDDIQVGDNFTYIPPNPKKFYKRLLEVCMIADLEVMLGPEVDDNEEVSLGILSANHIEITNECALRWRIGHPYRAACFLELVKQFYENKDIPMECVPEALSGISKVMNDVDLEKWPVQDVSIAILAVLPSNLVPFLVRISQPNMRRPLQYIPLVYLSFYGFYSKSQAR
jgi:hypothetical protein